MSREREEERERRIEIKGLCSSKMLVIREKNSGNDITE